ncbi:MAG: hypothetical protein JWM33_3947 [Caulobacteraceae bacterium]|nr:hypothetical protein [Caulobacteraceae bacterium]
MDDCEVAVRVLLALLVAAIPGLVAAHPIDEIVQGAYLTLSPGQVGLELDLTPGPEIAAGVLAALDANGDKKISATEARAFALEVLKASSLSLDGKRAVWNVEKVVAPPYSNLLIGADTLKIYATAKRPEVKGPHSFDYRNSFQPAKSQWTANVFLQPAGGWSYQVAGQARTLDGQGLGVRYISGRS